jgi:hypothetical protein
MRKEIQVTALWNRKKLRVSLDQIVSLCCQWYWDNNMIFGGHIVDLWPA